MEVKQISSIVNECVYFLTIKETVKSFFFTIENCFHFSGVLSNLEKIWMGIRFNGNYPHDYVTVGLHKGLTAFNEVLTSIPCTSGSFSHVYV